MVLKISSQVNYKSKADHCLTKIRTSLCTKQKKNCMNKLCLDVFMKFMLKILYRKFTRNFTLKYGTTTHTKL